MVVNTVLSVMAYDYPPEKLSVYLSDDGGSDITFYALWEASSFARFWLPYCTTFNIPHTCPAAYFNYTTTPPHNHAFNSIKVSSLEGSSGAYSAFKPCSNIYEPPCLIFWITYLLRKLQKKKSRHKTFFWNFCDSKNKTRRLINFRTRFTVRTLSHVYTKWAVRIWSVPASSLIHTLSYNFFKLFLR